MRTQVEARRGRAFPNDAPAIDDYARALDTARAAMSLRIVLKFLPRLLHAALLPLLRGVLPLRTTADVLSSLTANKRLVSALSYIWGARARGLLHDDHRNQTAACSSSLLLLTGRALSPLAPPPPTRQAPSACLLRSRPLG